MALHMSRNDVIILILEGENTTGETIGNELILQTIVNNQRSPNIQFNAKCFKFCGMQRGLIPIHTTLWYRCVLYIL